MLQGSPHAVLTPQKKKVNTHDEPGDGQTTHSTSLSDLTSHKIAVRTNARYFYLMQRHAENRIPKSNHVPTKPRCKQKPGISTSLMKSSSSTALVRGPSETFGWCVLPHVTYFSHIFVFFCRINIFVFCDQ